MSKLNDFLDVARSQIGVREGRDSDGNWNNRVKYTAWYADLVKDNQFRTAAWCEIFVSWCADQVGLLNTVIPRSAYTPAGLQWYTSRGLRVSTPRAGDIVYFYYSSVGAVGHIGIVESVGGGYITTIEGNTNTTGSSQGNGVYRLRRAISSTQRFVRPNYPRDSVVVPNPNNCTITKQVSVAHLKSARMTDPQQEGTPLGKYANEVYTMETALVKTEWIRPEDADGHFGTNTVGDGSSGYGGTTGFQKKHSGETNPDGWLGKTELTTLFKLAGMDVKVVA